MESKKEATKQKIFEASLRLFTHNGYGATTIRDIAKEAGISTGLLFHYFSSKKALLTAHLELAASGMESALALLESKQSPLQVFSSIAELTLAALREPSPRLLYLLMNQPLPNDAVDEELRQRIRKDRIIAVSTSVIERGQQLGQMRSGDPQALAVLFWSSIQGTAEILAEKPGTPIPDPNWIVDILRVRKAQS